MSSASLSDHGKTCLRLRLGFPGLSTISKVGVAVGGFLRRIVTFKSTGVAFGLGFGGRGAGVSSRPTNLAGVGLGFIEALLADILGLL